MELFADEIRKRERKRRRLEPLWGLLSFLLHGAFFAAVIFLTPVKSLVFEQKEKPRNAAEDLSADRIEDIGETLSEVRANELIKQIEEMQIVLHNMDIMKEELAKDYDAFAEKNAETAKEQLEKLIDETEQAQAKSVEAQKVVKGEIKELVRIETQEDLKKQETAKDLQAKRDKLMYETVEKTNTAQANAVNALDKLQTKAEFAAFKKTAAAAEKFREAQIEVARLQDSAQTAAIEIAAKMTSIADNAKWIAAHEKAVADGKNVKHHQTQLEKDYKRRDELEKIRQERATGKQVENLEKSEKAQKELNEKLEVLKATLAQDETQLEKLAQAEKREENKLVQKEARALAMSEAYELARQLETAVSESFKDVKSIETAMAKKMSFEAAAKLTDVAKPDRPEVDKQLLEEKVRTKEALDRQKAAQTEVVRVADAMAENAKAMMEKAMEIVWKGRTADYNAEAEFQLKLMEAAAEDSQAKAKDLAELMKGEDGSVEQKGAQGDTTGKNPGPPELKAGDLALVPGNVMSVGGDEKKGIPAKWMYVNSWYVIGPFPNPNRANLRRKFAPESKVDLDATYVGKDGRVLKWEYQQAKSSKPPQPWMADWHAEVVPEKSEEYAIFYAYAEVFFDEACDRWIAIGSDDRSDVWINDIPVWGSSNRLKQWQLAEDFRRVHFKKGRNKILARIENGHWNFGWSVCISTGDAAP